MAGFLALGNDQWLGEVKLNVAAGIENGVFVTANFATGLAILPAVDADGDGDVYFVVNENTNIEEDGINDVDFKIKDTKYLRLHYPQKGEVLVTTKYKLTPVAGDVLAVGDGGTVEAIGVRTPKIKFAVQKVTTAYGATALQLVVL